MRSNVIDIAQAIQTIKQACEATQSRTGSPYFFVVGAGISTPTIPLANEIVAACKTYLSTTDPGRFALVEKDEASSSVSSYSYWFNAAYRNPEERRLFLEGLIAQKPVTGANIKLAHLLSEARISNIVLTTNFDDQLIRAFYYFNSDINVFDHPKTVHRLSVLGKRPQLIYMHGIYKNYDICNTAEEIAARGSDGGMQGVITSIMQSLSPLVIGYSGNEDDAFMKALQQRLVNGLPYKAIWFFYDKASYDTAPNWVTSNDNVLCVLPHEAQHTSDDEDEDRSLRSNYVLDQILRIYDHQTPSILQNPIEFLASRVKLDFGELIDSRDDYYQIENLLGNIESLRLVYAERFNDTESTLVANLVRRARFMQAIKRIHKNVGTLLKIKNNAERVLNTTSYCLRQISNSNPSYLASAYAGVDIYEQALKKELAKYDIFVSNYFKLISHLASTEHRNNKRKEAVALILRYVSYVKGLKRSSFITHSLIYADMILGEWELENGPSHADGERRFQSVIRKFKNNKGDFYADVAINSAIILVEFYIANHRNEKARELRTAIMARYASHSGKLAIASLDKLRAMEVAS